MSVELLQNQPAESLPAADIYEDRESLLSRRRFILDSAVSALSLGEAIRKFSWPNIFSLGRSVEHPHAAIQALRASRNALSNLARFTEGGGFQLPNISQIPEVDLLFDPIRARGEFLGLGMSELIIHIRHNQISLVNLTTSDVFRRMTTYSIDEYLKNLGIGDKDSPLGLMASSTIYTNHNALGTVRGWLSKGEWPFENDSVSENPDFFSRLPANLFVKDNPEEDENKRVLGSFNDKTSHEDLVGDDFEAGKDWILLYMNNFRPFIESFNVTEDSEMGRLLKTFILAHEICHYYDISTNNDLTAYFSDAQLTELIRLKTRFNNQLLDIIRNPLSRRQSLFVWLAQEENKQLSTIHESFGYPMVEIDKKINELIYPKISSEIREKYELIDPPFSHQIIDVILRNPDDPALEPHRKALFIILYYYHHEVFAEIGSAVILCKLGYLDNKIPPEQQAEIINSPAGQYISYIIEALKQNGQTSVSSAISDNFDRFAL